MLVELVMARCDWDTVWYLGGTRPGRQARWWHAYRGGCCLVGVKTGPDGDLICVRRCATSAEAEANLSPPGNTVLHATLASVWKRWQTRKRVRASREL